NAACGLGDLRGAEQDRARCGEQDEFSVAAIAQIRLAKLVPRRPQADNGTAASDRVLRARHTSPNPLHSREIRESPCGDPNEPALVAVMPQLFERLHTIVDQGCAGG